MRRKTVKVVHFLLDCLWPSDWQFGQLIGEQSASKNQQTWPATSSLVSETIEAAYESLKDEQHAEHERLKTVETKLLGMSSLAPVAMAIVVAGFTVLASQKLETFTRGSVLLVGVAAGYVALQLLRAILAATGGLGRASYSHVALPDMYPLPGEKKEMYVARICLQLDQVIRDNRSAIDQKVTQMAIGHRAVKNAVCGLLLLLIIIIWLSAGQAYW